MKRERREARNLILLLSSASFIAFVAVVAVVSYFGSEGTYLLRNILVSPQTLERNAFTDYEPSTRPPRKLKFTKMEFVRADKHGKGWGRFLVSRQAYEAFYKLVYRERSLPVVTEAMLKQFNTAAPSTLTIFVEGLEAGETVFQQVQFLEGNELFRVQFHPLTRTRDAPEHWIYFRYPGIYDHAVELFAPSKSL